MSFDQLDLLGRAAALVPIVAVERDVLVAAEARRRGEGGHPRALGHAMRAAWPAFGAGPDLPATFGEAVTRRIADLDRISALGKLTVLT
jgi:hypothetical protein